MPKTRHLGDYALIKEDVRYSALLHPKLSCSWLAELARGGTGDSIIDNTLLHKADLKFTESWTAISYDLAWSTERGEGHNQRWTLPYEKKKKKTPPPHTHTTHNYTKNNRTPTHTHPQKTNPNPPKKNPTTHPPHHHHHYTHPHTPETKRPPATLRHPTTRPTPPPTTNNLKHQDILLTEM